MSETESKASKGRKWLWIGIGFGTGSVLMLTVVVGGIALYLNQPKPWNTEAIKPTFSQPIYSLLDNDFNISGMEFEYQVENRSKEDYTISVTDTFMVADKDGISPSRSGLYKVGMPCFIPSGSKVKCSLEASVDYDTSVDITGFVIFDTVRRYKIEFPKPTGPTPVEKKKMAAKFKDFKQPK
jgi:hypothetical protein